MKKLYIIFLALGSLLLLSLLSLPYSIDFASSIIPGWHTNLLPLYFIVQIILIPVFFILALVYWKRSKNKFKS